MSGPVATDDAPAVPESGHPEPAEVEVSDDRLATVGRLEVRRALPRRTRRTVGAWCFADHVGPAAVTPDAGIDIGPHPHMGLQTVTWLLSGQLLHHDSLGSEQVIKPGQLNLMTAGHGVAHAEEGTRDFVGDLHAIQLWVAQPEETRHGPAAFEHHADLPRLDLPGAVATVLVGDFAGAVSPARHDTALVGAELALQPGTVALPLRRDYEYAVLAFDGTANVEGQVLRVGQLAYLGLGRDQVAVEVVEPTRILLLGGEPFPEQIVMWWNFVGRDRGEFETAYGEWQAEDERFGRVVSRVPRIPAPAPYWTTT